MHQASLDDPILAALLAAPQGSGSSRMQVGAGPDELRRSAPSCRERGPAASHVWTFQACFPGGCAQVSGSGLAAPRRDCAHGSPLGRRVGKASAVPGAQQQGMLGLHLRVWIV